MQASCMLLYAIESQALPNIGGDKHATTLVLLTITQTGDKRETRVEVKASQSKSKLHHLAAGGDSCCRSRSNDQD
jgi:hypothetical protein